MIPKPYRYTRHKKFGLFKIRYIKHCIIIKSVQLSFNLDLNLQVETHTGKQGERTRYFDDDDKFDLKTLVSTACSTCAFNSVQCYTTFCNILKNIQLKINRRNFVLMCSCNFLKTWVRILTAS